MTSAHNQCILRRQFIILCLPCAHRSAINTHQPTEEHATAHVHRALHPLTDVEVLDVDEN